MELIRMSEFWTFHLIGPEGFEVWKDASVVVYKLKTWRTVQQRLMPIVCFGKWCCSPTNSLNGVLSLQGRGTFLETFSGRR